MRHDNSKEGSQFSERSLQNKVAIVTGASRGIGEAVALAFAREGAKLILASRTRSDLDQVSEKVGHLGAGASIVAGDVSRGADAQRMVDAAIGQHGCVDILVNAAAIHGPIGPLWETDAEGWIAALHVNLVGAFLCCRAAIPHMIANRRGKIINFSGGGATSPSPFLSAYGVSKAAVVRLTETLAAELSGTNIEVNAIAPGMVDTQIHDDFLSTPGIPREVSEPVRRLRETGQGGVPRELPANLAVFLASSKSDGLSGKLISAPHDDWQAWDQARIEELMSAPWLTLRRIDNFTLEPFLV